MGMLGNTSYKEFFKCSSRIACTTIMTEERKETGVIFMYVNAF